MESLLIIGVVLEGIFILALLWVAKILWEGIGALRATRQDEQKNREVLKAISEWTGRQSDREAGEDEQNNALFAHFKGGGDSETLPVALLTEAVLAKRKFVAPTLLELIDEAAAGLDEAIQQKDFARTESILVRLHELIDRNLLRCPWPDVAKVYANARHVTTKADEAIVVAIRENLSADQALTQGVPRRLVALAFSPDDVRNAQEKARGAASRAQWQGALMELAKAAAQIDVTNEAAGLELQRLDLRLTQLLSSTPDSAGNAELLKATQALQEARDHHMFESSLKAGKVSVEDIKAAFDRLGTVKRDLSQDIIKGHVFEEIDKALARCGFYFSVTSELKHVSFAEPCHAIPFKDFAELKHLTGDKQQRAYNSWALWLITETKKKLKDGESMIPMYDHKPLVSDLFPKVFNKVDDAMLNPSVSRLFYELHGRLIELVKKDSELVRKLINDQIFSSKVTVYQLNEV